MVNNTTQQQLNHLVNSLFPRETCPFLFKIVILGTCSGKSTLVNIYEEKELRDIKPTIGTDITITTTDQVYGIPILLNIWDTGSHQYFGERNWEQVFKHAHGIIYMCNDYDYEHFSEEFGTIIHNRIKKDTPSILILSSFSSNKVSLNRGKQEQNNIDQLATRLNIGHVFSLTQDKEEIQKAMNYLIAQMLEKYILSYFNTSTSTKEKAKRGSNSYSQNDFVTSFTSSLSNSLNSSWQTAKKIPSDISMSKKEPSKNGESCHVM
eukprot:gb/GECH01003714.1/.p1 GENE.gb/GECH01003714.1/~~gb/GECH01003714.1/.p1  ORF type:complete len:264 (+),score=51.16 gb/GECH01003714.1/:1-792(+)